MPEKYLVLFIAIFITCKCTAQKITVKNDTIYVDNKVFGILKILRREPLDYTINTIGGQELIAIHYSRIEIKGVPAYIFTFLNDRKQGIIASRSKKPASFITLILKNNLVQNNAINGQAETAFLAAHPLPQGYTDPNNLIEY